MHLENPEYFQWHSHKKVEGPFTSTVLLESPSISHTWRFILPTLTILTLPFSLTISKVKLQNVSKRCLFSFFFLMRKTTFWISDSIWNTQVFSLPQFCAWLIFGGCGRGQKNQTGRDRDCRYAAKAALSSLIYGPPNSSPPKDLAYIYLDAGNAIKNAVHISIFEGWGTFSQIDYWCIFGE